MFKLCSRKFLEAVAIIGVICFSFGFLLQIFFHIVPPSGSSVSSSVLRGASGNLGLGVNQLIVDGIVVSRQDIEEFIKFRSDSTVSTKSRVSSSSVSSSRTSSSTSSSNIIPSVSATVGKLKFEDQGALPNIVRAWRDAKLDWHQILPTHNSVWERFGTPVGEARLRQLVNKEVMVTDYLTRFHESGLSSMFGHNHGLLKDYSGCNSFFTPCVIHSKDSCQANQLCRWSSTRKLCIDVWDKEPMTANDTLPVVSEKCPHPSIVVDGSFREHNPSQCKYWIDQPAISISIDSESQSMFYHWWATWTGIVSDWKGRDSRRDIHYFVEKINDPMFFHFFGLITDNCWRRMSEKLHSSTVCFCKVSSFQASQSRLDAADGARQMISYLQLDSVKPRSKVPRIGLISRRRKRFILNEYELVQHVQNMGFECVLLPLESMTLFEQLNELRNLDVLVGIHGSALDNAVFLNPGSVLVQLLPYRVEHRVTFRQTAEAAGVHYMEWQLKDPSKTVFHWDLLMQANDKALEHISKEQYLAKGQAGADSRETLMFWINQDIIVPLNEWEDLIRRAVKISPAAARV